MTCQASKCPKNLVTPVLLLIHSSTSRVLNHTNLSNFTYAELARVWRSVFDSLECADKIVSIGYSFRDSHFNQFLFEASRKRNTLQKLLIVTMGENDYNQISNRLSWIDLETEPVLGGLEEFAAECGNHK